MIYIALLRGINVGGNNLIKMSALREICESVGFSNISTYINSGNIILCSEDDTAQTVASKISMAIQAKLRLTITVVAYEMEAYLKIIDAIPKTWLANNHLRANVIFLSNDIDKSSIVTELHPKNTIEEVFYVPGALLWAAQTSDLSKSSMLKLSKSRMYKNMTVRNLNTATRLSKIAQDTNQA
jgi:uncharacterized protein (DUF1697 family)